jgi:PEP-CTERM motif-containing protein
MRRTLGLALFLWLFSTLNAGAASILINPGPALSASPDALAAFNRAATTWGTLLTDPVTVTITANLVSLANPSVIGSTSSVVLTAGYTLIRNAMVADAADEPDDAIVASLPTAAQFTAFLPTGFSLNGNLVATKANLKALGFTGLDAAFGASDATMSFNSNFAFDYDNSNGVGAGLIDFETVALHEIGHALGFLSWVDIIDVLAAQNTPMPVAFSTLDLFRFSAAAGLHPTTAAEFTTDPRMLVPGQAAVFSDASREFAFSTGVNFGDGRQASHWKDDALTGVHIGVMDPSLAAATVAGLTPADIHALDVIGWDVSVPEPSTMVLVAGGLIVALRRRSRRD